MQYSLRQYSVYYQTVYSMATVGMKAECAMDTVRIQHANSKTIVRE